MEDELIGDEVAILAKQKGFNEPSVLVRYFPPKIDKKTGWEIKAKGAYRRYEHYKNKPKDGIERIHVVSQTVMQKWLREKHDIHILVVSSNISGYNYAVDNEKGLLGISTKEFPFKTYEEALEAALLEGLKMI